MLQLSWRSRWLSQTYSSRSTRRGFCQMTGSQGLRIDWSQRRTRKRCLSTCRGIAARCLTGEETARATRSILGLEPWSSGATSASSSLSWPLWSGIPWKNDKPGHGKSWIGWLLSRGSAPKLYQHIIEGPSPWPSLCFHIGSLAPSWNSATIQCYFW